MVAVLIVTHGGLARELQASAERIAGDAAQLRALCLDWNDTFETARQRVEEEIGAMDTREGLLILTDMYGSTPYNVAASFAAPDVAVLAGVNLPMVVRLACAADKGMDAGATATWLAGKGKRAICGCGMEKEREDG